MCRSKARSGPGCCCRQRVERVRSFAESARPDCRAVPFPLDRDCHHRGFNVPLDVIDKMTQAILVVLHSRERLLKSAEHLRDNVLATVKKCRNDLLRRPRLGQRHRMRNKGSDMRRHARPHHPRFDRRADCCQRAKRLELAGAGTDVRHSAEVEIEVADIGAVRIDICLLANHDVVDQTRCPCIVRRKPRHFCACRSCCSRFSSDMKSQTAKT